MTPAVHLLVTGKVQGVYFRESTRAEADRLGVSGWVRNLTDGRVEALLAGPGEAVEALVAWCHHGPPAARVDDLARTPSSEAPDGPFQVRPTAERPHQGLNA
ncbi:MAG: acylphosphatase [Thermoplasmatota archaeon]